MTPREIVRALDRHIVGQERAKRALAVALRNRWRRRQVPDGLRDEIMPFNIILIGPTGVGKTELARRLAALAQAPFIKVEASRFTEVGYVGRDAESMVRDLVELAVQRERGRELDRLRAGARAAARARVLERLLPDGLRAESLAGTPTMESRRTLEAARRRALARLERQLDAGQLAGRELDVEESVPPPALQLFNGQGMEDLAAHLQEWLGEVMPRPLRLRRLAVEAALELFEEEEAGRLLDMETLVRRAVQRCEQDGIIFIDEIDKICAPLEGAGPDVSRQGVQKDILPVIEGTTVHTRHGPVRTDHMLFIASGAFHLARPQDLIPELQGRFPVRVELDSLDRRALERILTEPEHSLLRQYQALFQAEGVALSLDAGAVRELAELAHAANRKAENIGARRLHSLMHMLLERELFELPGKPLRKLAVDAARVRRRLAEVVEDIDLSRYVL